MKKTDSMIYVEKRLEQWAEWFSKGNYYGLGFHSKTIEYILMTVGVMIKSTAVRPLPCNREAEEIEALVAEMARHNKKMAMALRLHYFDRKKLCGRPKTLQVSTTQFKQYVSMAKQWLAGRLSAYARREL